MKTLILFTVLFFCPSLATAFSFGFEGRDGENGMAGRDGRDGQDIVVKASGDFATYNLSGGEGGAGGAGEFGHSATSCQQPINATHNLEGADGGDGGNGGVGGRGGHGGDVTVYFTDLEALRKVHVLSTPGSGGFGNWGGRGGDACHCQTQSWKPEGSDTTYYCQNGSRGRDGSGGARGSSGSYGRIVLITGLEPLVSDKPSATVDMAALETTTLELTKNNWEARVGARQLFHPTSDISNNYQIYTGRDAVTYSFRWEVARPVADFKGWRVTVQLESHKPKLYLPSGLWVDGELLQEGNHFTYVFRAAVSGAEFGQLRLDEPSGIGLEHVISVEDTAEVSEILRTKVKLRFMTVENGQYKDRFHADVPTEAITVTSKRIQIAVRKLGVDEAFLKLGTQVYIGLILTRSIGSNDFQYSLGRYYTIQYVFAVGNAVEVSEDASLYSGNQVVGAVKKGEKFTVNKIVGEWISLKKPDGTVVSGWVQSKHLKPA